MTNGPHRANQKPSIKKVFQRKTLRMQSMFQYKTTIKSILLNIIIDILLDFKTLELI